MHVQIAICTWNRAPLLNTTLTAIERLKVPDDWRLQTIVVDNHSTDDTAHVIEQFADRIDLITSYEPRQGHSHARNRAIEIADSDWLIWTDDDVCPDSDWLAAYDLAIKQYPECAFFGGPIRVRFEGTPPAWIRDNWDKLKGCYAERLLGDDSLEFTPQRLPYGANWSVRTELQKGVRYRPGTGRQGHQVVGHDEFGVMRQMLEQGYEGRWVPQATVEHRIDSARQTIHYVQRYFQGQGRMLVAENRAWTDDRRQLERTARWETWCGRLKRPWTRSDVWLSHLIHGALARGQVEAMKQAG